MKESPVYHVMTRPKSFLGLPLDYATFAFGFSLGLGGFVGIHATGNGLGALLGTLPPALVFWVIGVFKTKSDPEFFSVWKRNCFKIGDLVRFDGVRKYNP